MTSITMAPKRLDNLLPAGAGERWEADYPCFAVTLVIMYHLDGSTANTAWVPASPSELHLLLFIRLPQRVGGLRLLASALGSLELASGFFSQTPGSFHCYCAEAKEKGLQQDTDRSPTVTWGWGWGGEILSHVPSLHHGGRSGKEDSGKNLSVLVYAPQTFRSRGQVASPLRAEVCHWCGGATQGSLGLVARMRKVKTQQVGLSASFLLAFLPWSTQPLPFRSQSRHWAPGPEGLSLESAKD